MARGIICVVFANEDLGLDEFTAVGEAINAKVDPEALVIIGTALDANLGQSLQVVLLATGLPVLPRGG
jgi:cell division protein FtsZ